ncbi:phage T7 F exclusion suppressor FxsA [Bacillus sp. TS-2]|nr:phage T7 F exclusion suppressor FxsA [Bacillus sp. TS-2]
MPKFILLFILIFSALEITGFILVGKLIGVFPTLLLVIFTSIIGAWLAKREGLQAIRVAQLQTSQGQMPSSALLDGLCILLGGLALLVPGFLSDIVGFLLLIPFTRTWFKALLKKQLNRLIQKGNFVVMHRR